MTATEYMPLKYTGVPLREPTTRFGELLRRYRLRQRTSQLDLGMMAGLNASYISRLESGVRGVPSRECIDLIANALRLHTDERNELLYAAGYVVHDPLVAEALAILADATIPLAVRLRLRSDIAAVVAAARGGAA